jgi:hypothetical protein
MGHLLLETEDEPASAPQLGKSADGSHGGCSVCRRVAEVSEPDDAPLASNAFSDASFVNSAFSDAALMSRPVFAAPPTRAYADGSHGGCSVCRLSAVFDAASRRIHVELPSDTAPPEELEAVIEVDDQGRVRHFRPDPAAVGALLADRQADWFVPVDVLEPTRLTMSLRYREANARAVGTRVVTVA